MSKKKEENLLGQIVKDKVTGYQGVATSKVNWLFGCEQYLVVKEDPCKEVSRIMDTGRLEVIREKEDLGEITFPEINHHYFGAKVIDNLTGFIGICIGAESRLFLGSPRYAIEAAYDECNDKDNESLIWVEESRLNILEEEPDPENYQGDTKGGILPGYMYQGL